MLLWLSRQLALELGVGGVGVGQLLPDRQCFPVGDQRRLACRRSRRSDRPGRSWPGPGEPGIRGGCRGRPGGGRGGRGRRPAAPSRAACAGPSTPRVFFSSGSLATASRNLFTASIARLAVLGAAALLSRAVFAVQLAFLRPGRCGPSSARPRPPPVRPPTSSAPRRAVTAVRFRFAQRRRRSARARDTAETGSSASQCSTSAARARAVVAVGRLAGHRLQADRLQRPVDSARTCRGGGNRRASTFAMNSPRSSPSRTGPGR